jgi:ribonuclease HI
VFGLDSERDSFQYQGSIYHFVDKFPCKPAKLRPNTKPNFAVFNNADPPLDTSPSPFVPSAWDTLLLKYPGDLRILLAGILRHGCRFSTENLRHQLHLCDNLVSAKEDPEAIDSQLQIDLRAGSAIEVQLKCPLFLSPIGLVPKHNMHGLVDGWRRIHHLSYPHGASVNDSITEEEATMSLLTVFEVFQLVADAGRFCVIMKKDIKNAFRNIPVSVVVQWLLGFTWGGKYYTECCLPFGLRSAPFLFNLFAEAFHWILESHLSWTLGHYLDDFIRVIARSRATPKDLAAAHQDYIWLTDLLGVPRNDKKDSTGTSGIVLGIRIDSVTMQASLPPDKLRKAHDATALALAKDSLTFKEAESLAGFLVFCTKVVPLGRSFLHALWSFCSTFTHKSHSRRLTKRLREELQWWRDLLPTHHGIILLDPSQRQTFHLYTDACEEGYGGFYFNPLDVPGGAKQPKAHPWQSNSSRVACKNNRLPSWEAHAHSVAQNHSFAERVNRKDRRIKTHINILEVQAILIAFQKWSNHWSKQRIIVFTDSSTALSGLTKLSLHGKANKPLREILQIAASLDITFEAHHIPGANNTLADALSRLHIEIIADLCPHWQYPYRSP